MMNTTHQTIQRLARILADDPRDEGAKRAMVRAIQRSTALATRPTKALWGLSAMRELYAQYRAAQITEAAQFTLMTHSVDLEESLRRAMGMPPYQPRTTTEGQYAIVRPNGSIDFAQFDGTEFAVGQPPDDTP